MSALQGTDAIAEQILDGTASERIRAAAARGALPLPRPVLVRLYLHLRGDTIAEIAAAAENSLAAMDAAAIGEVLSDPFCTPQVLLHYAKPAARNEQLAEKLAFHASVPLPALEILAMTGSGAVVELVLTNQERLLETPRLLEKLMLNPALRPDQRGRILELLERMTRQREHDARAKKSADSAAEADDEPDDLEELAELLEVDVGDLLTRSEIIDGEEFAEAKELSIRNAYQKIITLKTAQKAILAMKGGRVERLILIRDTNKTVALGVLKNPRMNDSEAEVIANMRNVSDIVLRQVGSTRQWVKKYSVVVALCNNPRTPQSVTSNFVARLTNKDLKQLARSHDVPELIRKMAKRIHGTRTQMQSNPMRKK